MGLVLTRLYGATIGGSGVGDEDGVEGEAEFNTTPALLGILV